MKRTLKKMNDQGEFTLFPGITVVAGIKNEDSALWKAVYDSIADSDLLRQYFAPLPHASYHMTTMDLFTEKQHGGDDWAAFVQSKLGALQDLHALLKENELNPAFELKMIVSDGVIQLYGALPREQAIAINRTAAKSKFFAHVSKEFHITLAYQHTWTSEEDAVLIEQELESKLNPLLAGKKITLNPPKLCYFNDMTAFIPWDGRSDPFQPKTNGFLSQFSFLQGTRQAPQKQAASSSNMFGM